MLLRASISITGFPRLLQGLNINQVPTGLIYTHSRSEGERCLSCRQPISVLCTAARFHAQQRRPFIKDTFPSNKGCLHEMPTGSWNSRMVVNSQASNLAHSKGKKKNTQEQTQSLFCSHIGKKKERGLKRSAEWNSLG